MVYDLLMFAHVGSMFLATALAIGPITVFVLVLRTGDPGLIRRVFAFAEPLSRAGGVAYGVGVIFGVSTALNGGISLTSGWLLAAYGLLALLVVSNLYADRWLRQVLAEARASGETVTPGLTRWIHSSGPLWALGASALITVGLVFVMVVKPGAAG